MISFINNTNSVEVVVNKAVLPEQYWDSYRKAIIEKTDVGRIVLDINDNHVSIYFKNGDISTLSYQVIDASHNCSSNEDLYNLLKGFLNL